MKAVHQLIYAEMLAALHAAVALSDRELPKSGGYRTPECQAVYDRCVAAIAKAGDK